LVSHHETDVDVLADRIIRLVMGSIQSDRAGTKTLNLNTVQPERIQRIYFDETHQEWVIETATVLLRSANPAWGRLQVNDVIRVSPF
jgi:molybdate transport system ATP-binding protein